MAGPYTRFSFLFQIVTDPVNKADAISHIGGWSEQHCWPGVIAGTSPQVASLATKRAVLLPSQASLVGVRRTQFSTSGNKIISSGSQTFGVARPGGTAVTDLPQVALTLKIASEAGTNSSLQCLRCIPDTFMQRGEFQPSDNYRSLLRLYCDELQNQNWAFMGRDTSQPTAAVTSIVDNKITSSVELGVAVGDYLRLLKVVNSVTGDPISGSFRVTAVIGKESTVVGLPAGAVALDSGLVRKDVITICNIGRAEFNRAVVRKIGRPFEAYRGRASNRRR